MIDKVTCPDAPASRVLVVDDEAGVLAAIQRLFLDEPYQLLTASSGAEALDLLRREGGVQVIISDYRMPGMTGVEFLRETIMPWPDTRRVILSAFTDSDILLAAVNEGRVHRYIAKPWDNDALRRTVTELLHEYYALLSIRADVEDLARRNSLLASTNQQLGSLLDELLRTVRGDTSVFSYPLPVTGETGQSEQRRLPLHATLSDREYEVLCRTGAGQQPKAIAHDLGLSIKTVSTYKQRLSAKMGFRNDADLIAYALTNSLPCKINPTNR